MDAWMEGRKAEGRKGKRKKETKKETTKGNMQGIKQTKTVLNTFPPVGYVARSFVCVFFEK